MDKTLKTMAIEFAEYQVNFNSFLLECDEDFEYKLVRQTCFWGVAGELNVSLR